MKRRRRRRHNIYKKNSAGKMALSTAVMIIFSIFAGYATASFIIGPALDLETQPASLNFFDNTTEKNDTKDKVDSDNTEKKVVQDNIDTVDGKGFALQYGSFSTQTGAQECAQELKKDGMNVQILEKNGSFKVISQLFDTKDEARMYMEQQTDVEDVFITEIP